MLALGEYSELKDRYEQQLELNQAAEQFARQVCLPASILLNLRQHCILLHTRPDSVHSDFGAFINHLLTYLLTLHAVNVVRCTRIVKR